MFYNFVCSSNKNVNYLCWGRIGLKFRILGGWKCSPGTHIIDHCPQNVWLVTEFTWADQCKTVGTIKTMLFLYVVV